MEKKKFSKPNFSLTHTNGNTIISDVTALFCPLTNHLFTAAIQFKLL